MNSLRTDRILDQATQEGVILTLGNGSSILPTPSGRLKSETKDLLIEVRGEIIHRLKLEYVPPRLEIVRLGRWLSRLVPRMEMRKSSQKYQCKATLKPFLSTDKFLEHESKDGLTWRHLNEAFSEVRRYEDWNLAKDKV